MQINGLGALVRNYIQDGLPHALTDCIKEAGMEPPEMRFPIPCFRDVPSVYLPIITFVANYDSSSKERKVAARIVRMILRRRRHTHSCVHRRLAVEFNSFKNGVEVNEFVLSKQP